MFIGDEHNSSCEPHPASLSSQPRASGPPSRRSSAAPLASRASVLAGGLALLGALLVASRLTPDPRGLGTHRQLGLPPCTSLIWFGMRCPACGMTTAWAHVMHGRPDAALQANAGGTLLALAAIPLALWMLASACSNRWLGAPPSERWILAASLLVVLVTLADWLRRILS